MQKRGQICPHFFFFFKYVLTFRPSKVPKIKKSRDKPIQIEALLLLCAGNDDLHMLTSYNTRQRLRVDLTDFEGNTAYAEYDNFAVGSEREKYRLIPLGQYSGTAGRYDVKTRIPDF